MILLPNAGDPGPSRAKHKRGSSPAPDVGLTVWREIARKGLHLLSVVVPITYAAGLDRLVLVVALGFALAVATVIEVARAKNERARAMFEAKLGQLLRAHETEGLSGATWLIVALLIAAVTFPRDIAIAAMAAVAVGDAAAAIIGRALAGNGGHGKSVAGSVACFAASAFTARAIADLAWREAFLVGLLAALAERLRRPFDDNLRITLAVGCGILLWRMGFS